MKTLMALHAQFRKFQGFGVNCFLPIFDGWQEYESVNHKNYDGNHKNYDGI